MPMLLITVTSGRPTAFNDYLTKWVRRQTFQEFDWLVVSDNSEEYKFSKKIKLVEREGTSPLCSMCANWTAALDWIAENGEKYDRFVVLEDDDYYAANYLFEQNKMLDSADLCGYNEDAYYFVLHRRPHRLHNRTHAALASTAFRRPVLPLLREIVSKNSVTIDTQLWNAWTGTKLLHDNFDGRKSGTPVKLDPVTSMAPENPRHVGCKDNWHGGVESASGYTVSGGFDNSGKIARRWFGDDAAAYLKYTKTPAIGTPFLLLEMEDGYQKT